MSDAKDDPKARLLMTAGAVVVMIGMLLQVVVGLLGLAVVGVGFVVLFTGPYVHDRQHKRLGEPTHAMWGDPSRRRRK